MSGSVQVSRLGAVPEQFGKAPVRVETTVNLTLSDHQTVNGVALTTGDRVLVKNQTVLSENGIYIVGPEFDPWKRAPDMDRPEDVYAYGAVTSQETGTFYFIDIPPGTYWSPGLTDIEFVQFSEINIFPEAPIDGNQYARQDGLWAQVALPVLGALTDVDLTGVANGDVIAYNSTSGNWEVSPRTTIDWGDIGGTLSGQTDLQAALDLKAPLANPVFTGSLTVSDAASPSIMVIDTTAGVTGRLIATDSDVRIGSTTAHPVSIQTNAVSAIDIDSSQNSVFAGTVTADTAINIDSGATGSPFLQFKQNGVDRAYIQFLNPDELRIQNSLGIIDFYPQNTLALRLDSTAGISTFDTKLVDITTGLGLTAAVRIAGNNNVPGVTAFEIQQDGVGAAYLWQRANANLFFGTNNTAAMRIDVAQDILTNRNLTIGDGTQVSVQSVINASATGNPALRWQQGGVNRAYVQYLDTGDEFRMQNGIGDITFYPGNTLALTLDNVTRDALFQRNVAVGDGTQAAPSLRIDSSAAGEPIIRLSQAGVTKSSIEHVDAGDVLTIASVGTMLFSTSAATFTGILTVNDLIDVGTNDTANGIIQLFGDGTGSTSGGELRFYTASDHDLLAQYYRWRPVSSDFILGTDTINLITVGPTGDTNLVGGLTVDGDSFFALDGVDGLSVTIRHLGATNNPGIFFSSHEVNNDATIDFSSSGGGTEAILKNNSVEWLRVDASQGAKFTRNVTVGDQTQATPTLTIASTATGSPRLSFDQTVTNRAFIEYTDVGDIFTLSTGGSVEIITSSTTAIDINSSGQCTFAENITSNRNLTVGNATQFTPQITIDSNATGNPLLEFSQAGTQKAFMQYRDTGDFLKIDSDGEIHLFPSNILSAEFSTTQAVLGNMAFNIDQIIGAGQDNYVLTYDNTSGEISLEAAAGGDVLISGTPVNDQLAVWTSADTVEGTANLTYTGTQFKANNYVFDVGQTLGAGQDNYVMTYNNSTGLISLEIGAATVTQLSDLSDVGTATPTIDHVLVGDGTDFDSRQLDLNDLTGIGSIVFTTSTLSYTGSLTFTNAQTFNGRATIKGALTLQADTLGTTGTLTANFNDGAYFSTGNLTGNVTFAFAAPTTSGFVTSFYLEINNGGNATSITWPTALDWPGSAEPTWTTNGRDIIKIQTRDAGVTYSATDISLNMG